MARAAVMERRLAGTTSDDDKLNHSNYFTSDEETDDQVIDTLEKEERLLRQRLVMRIHLSGVSCVGALTVQLILSDNIRD